MKKMTRYEEKEQEQYPNVMVHSEISQDLDYDHETALETLLKDCTDEQLISEIARRKLDLQHKVTSELVAKYYHFEKLIGHGASGKVYLVYHRESGQKFACKVIHKNSSMNDTQSMTTEIEIMKRIRHRYVVSLYELFESVQCMWLILELVEGTGLRGVLANSSHYSEITAARFIKQMLQGIHYLHNHGVIHRDLKIDNMLLHGDLETGMVKIADFGLSALIRPGTKGYHCDESQKRKTYTGLTDMWGTPTHYSPELINKTYGPQSDMWSLGCMMYEMLTGEEAFPSKEEDNRKELYRRIRHGQYSRENLKGISSEAQDLISHILEPDPVRRLVKMLALKLYLLLELLLGLIVDSKTLQPSV
jgi:serine/threonine protein kinase